MVWVLLACCDKDLSSGADVVEQMLVTRWRARYPFGVPPSWGDGQLGFRHAGRRRVLSLWDSVRRCFVCRGGSPALIGFRRPGSDYQHNDQGENLEE